LGVKLGDIIPPEAVEEVNLQFFNGKSVAIDGFNALYQFLATIRGPDGRPLMDSKGRVTSHLSGLFFRTLNLLEENVKVGLRLRRPAAGAEEGDDKEACGGEEGRG